MFQGPLVPTAVSRAKQGRAEIDDTGLIPSFIRDVIFPEFWICFGCTASLHFHFHSTTTRSSLTSCLLTDDLRPSSTSKNVLCTFSICVCVSEKACNLKHEDTIKAH